MLVGVHMNFKLVPQKGVMSDLYPSKGVMPNLYIPITDPMDELILSV